MKYYFLVAYLPEIHRDDKKLKIRLSDLLAEKNHVTEQDWKQVELLLLAGDLLQIERLLRGKSVEVEYSLYGMGFWREQLKSPKDVPEFMAEQFETIAAEGLSPRNLERIHEAYYDYVIEKTSSPFLRAYMIFERDLRNTVAAVRARRRGLPPSDSLVGEGDVVDQLSRSSGEDFGLSAEYAWIEKIVSAKGPLEMEEAIQQIIWDTIDEMTEKLDFDFDVVLAYLLKLHLVERNISLSEEQGMETVRHLEEL
ncbi:MAG: hypothetical protein CVU64_15385 [Deltaproteobacteria bacterium HGW-Deltaproteobacteria-21]|nr:MAG: hypothetical protein CVU64_15385 [Deltaproteobacteria bacterium HGW-Deltaproteobacteria-21]